MSAAEASPERWVRIPGYEGLYEVSDFGAQRAARAVAEKPAEKPEVTAEDAFPAEDAS